MVEEEQKKKRNEVEEITCGKPISRLLQILPLLLRKLLACSRRNKLAFEDAPSEWEQFDSSKHMPLGRKSAPQAADVCAFEQSSFRRGAATKPVFGAEYAYADASSCAPPFRIRRIYRRS